MLRRIPWKWKTSCSSNHHSKSISLPLSSSCRGGIRTTCSKIHKEQDLDSMENTLIRLNNARLGYNTQNPIITNQVNLSIRPATYGGHAIIGRNGHGKTLLSSILSIYPSDDDSKQPNQEQSSKREEEDGAYLVEGNIQHGSNWYQNSISTVSFESHYELLNNTQQQEESPPKTVYQALTPYGGRLNKATQYLVVRFGLYPLLNSPINGISTGEIRKVLLIRALSTRPKLLVLDNAFDGLDVGSRDILGDLVNRTLRGFTPDLLVQAVSAKDAAHTQVLMMTHRAEEIVDEVSTVSMMQKRSMVEGGSYHDGEDGGGAVGLVTEGRNGRTGDELMWLALQNKSQNDDDDDVLSPMEAKQWNSFDDNVWNDTSLPSTHDISTLWDTTNHTTSQQRKSSSSLSLSSSSSTPLVSAQHLRVQRGEHTPISNLNWTVQKAQRWLVAGGNGAGKSTLSRLLAHHNNNTTSNNHNKKNGIIHGTLEVNTRDNIVGWVSTELHMQMVQSTQTSREIIRITNHHAGGISPSSSNPCDDVITNTIAKWLHISPSLLDRPFHQLSQGEQKLVLIASSLSSRPSLLVLDEPCQGLDVISRRRVLGLVERLCQATDVALVYITHHLEELIPSVTNVLHLVEGEVVYNGDVDLYDPSSSVISAGGGSNNP